MANYKIYYKGLVLGGDPDSSFIPGSTNTVQSYVIQNGLAEKFDKFAGVAQKTKLAYVMEDGYLGFIDQKQVTPEYDKAMSDTSYNAVGNAYIKNYVDTADAFTYQYVTKELILDLDESTYILTVGLKDNAGNVMQKSVDFPSEQLIIDVDYDEETKELIIKLKNGTVRRIYIGDIVSGLVKESHIVDNAANAYAAGSTYVASAYAVSYTFQTLVETAYVLQNEIEELEEEFGDGKLDKFQGVAQKTKLAYVQDDGYIGFIDQKQVTPEYDKAMSDTSYNAVGNAYIKNYVDTAYANLFDYAKSYLLEDVIKNDEKITAYAFDFYDKKKLDAYVGTSYAGQHFTVDETGYLTVSDDGIRFVTAEEYAALPASEKDRNDVLFIVR